MIKVISDNFLIRKSLRASVILLLLATTVFVSSCSKNTKAGEDITATPSPVMTPEEAPESYQNDIDEYEPTDSLSQDSDGPVH